MPTITVSQEVYDRLAARAAANGVTVEDEVAGETTPRPTSNELNAHERAAILARLHAHSQSRAHLFPPGFVLDDSRETIYEGCGE